MTDELSPSVFASFNARNLSPRQVAKEFIPPPRHFDDLVHRRHSLVVGPRGSGKTTLLKMLQLQALAAWEHPEADRYRRLIDFVGVFVPADVSWGAQLEAVDRRTNDGSTISTLGLSAFTTHVLLALVDAMRDCTSAEVGKVESLQSKFVQINKAEEVELCSLISANWQLAPQIPTFLGLTLALRDRLSKIALLWRKVRGLNEEQIDESFREFDFLYLGFIESAMYAIEVFNNKVGQPDRKWAFLFDELEIVPKDIRTALFTSLRSVDSRLLFKLSISPYHEDIGILEAWSSAMAGHDYQPIELWYPRKEEGYQFSESLMHAMLSDMGVAAVPAEDVFGSSIFDAGDEDRIDNTSGYRPGSTVHKRFKDLAAKDASFSAYLRKNKIDIDRMHELADSTRASIIRKGTSVAAVREAFRSNENLEGAPTREQTSRKNPVLFTGSRSLFAIIEGNPRWFIGIIRPMLARYAHDKRKVPKTIQSKAVSTASNRFRALLRTIPFTSPNSPTRGLLSLIDRVGDEFHRNVVHGPFNPDPPLSFVVDSNAQPDLLRALEKALNAGAIILAFEPGSDGIISSLKGKRFRLSYMLAPHYAIPLTLGRSVALSSLIERRSGDGSQLTFVVA